jgi:hypothetical protein
MRGRGQVLGRMIDHPQHTFPNTQIISVSSFFRNYVFQRRFVQFNGRSLMYFGSDKVGDGSCCMNTRERKMGRTERGSGLEGLEAHGRRMTTASRCQHLR